MAGVQRDFRQCNKILIKNHFVCERITGGHHIYRRGSDIVVMQTKPNAMIFQQYIKKFNLKL